MARLGFRSKETTIYTHNQSKVYKIEGERPGGRGERELSLVGAERRGRQLQRWVRVVPSLGNYSPLWAAGARMSHFKGDRTRLTQIINM